MGVSYNNCPACDRIYADCGDYVSCEACGTGYCSPECVRSFECPVVDCYDVEQAVKQQRPVEDHGHYLCSECHKQRICDTWLEGCIGDTEKDSERQECCDCSVVYCSICKGSKLVDNRCQKCQKSHAKQEEIAENNRRKDEVLKFVLNKAGFSDLYEAENAAVTAGIVSHKKPRTC